MHQAAETCSDGDSAECDLSCFEFPFMTERPAVQVQPSEMSTPDLPVAPCAPHAEHARQVAAGLATKKNTPPKCCSSLDDNATLKKQARRGPQARKKQSLASASTSSDPLDANTDETVIDAGIITRAPLPIAEAEQMEFFSGAEDGAYFVELMRKRLRCIHDIQVRWAKRACNKKKPVYVETQTRLKDFVEGVLNVFDLQFGPASPVLSDVPTRRHKKPRITAPPPSPALAGVF